MQGSMNEERSMDVSEEVPDVTAAVDVDDEIVRGTASVQQSIESHPAVEHQPFNNQLQEGRIIKIRQYIDSEIANNRPGMKHCYQDFGVSEDQPLTDLNGSVQTINTPKTIGIESEFSADKANTVPVPLRSSDEDEFIKYERRAMVSRDSDNEAVKNGPQNDLQALYPVSPPDNIEFQPQQQQQRQQRMYHVSEGTASEACKEVIGEQDEEDEEYSDDADQLSKHKSPLATKADGKAAAFETPIPSPAKDTDKASRINTQPAYISKLRPGEHTIFAALEKHVINLNHQAMALLKTDQFNQVKRLLHQAEVSLVQIDKQCSELKANTDSIGNLNDEKLFQNQQSEIEELEELKNRLMGLTYNNFGCLCKQQKDFKGALEYLKRALDFESKLENFESQQEDGLGTTSRSVEDEDALQVAYQHDLKTTNCNSAGTILNICAILSKIGKHAQAHDYAEEAGVKLNHSMKLTKGQAEVASSRIKEMQEKIELMRISSSPNEKDVKKIEQEVAFQQQLKMDLENQWISLATTAVIAHYNSAVELEFLSMWREALQSYEKAANLASVAMKAQNPMSQKIAQAISKMRMKVRNKVQLPDKLVLQQRGIEKPSTAGSTSYGARLRSYNRSWFSNSRITSQMQGSSHETTRNTREWQNSINSQRSNLGQNSNAQPEIRTTNANSDFNNNQQQTSECQPTLASFYPEDSIISGHNATGNDQMPPPLQPLSAALAKVNAKGPTKDINPSCLKARTSLTAGTSQRRGIDKSPLSLKKIISKLEKTEQEEAKVFYPKQKLRGVSRNYQTISSYCGSTDDEAFNTISIQQHQNLLIEGVTQRNNIQSAGTQSIDPNFLPSLNQQRGKAGFFSTRSKNIWTKPSIRQSLSPVRQQNKQKLSLLNPLWKDTIKRRGQKRGGSLLPPAVPPRAETQLPISDFEDEKLVLKPTGDRKKRRLSQLGVVKLPQNLNSVNVNLMAQLTPSALQIQLSKVQEQRLSDQNKRNLIASAKRDQEINIMLGPVISNQPKLKSQKKTTGLNTIGPITADLTAIKAQQILGTTSTPTGANLACSAYLPRRLKQSIKQMQQSRKLDNNPNKKQTINQKLETAFQKEMTAWKQSRKINESEATDTVYSSQMPPGIGSPVPYNLSSHNQDLASEETQQTKLSQNLQDLQQVEVMVTSDDATDDIEQPLKQQATDQTQNFHADVTEDLDQPQKQLATDQTQIFEEIPSFCIPDAIDTKIDRTSYALSQNSNEVQTPIARVDKTQGEISQSSQTDVTPTSGTKKSQFRIAAVPDQISQTTPKTDKNESRLSQADVDNGLPMHQEMTFSKNKSSAMSGNDFDGSISPIQDYQTIKDKSQTYSVSNMTNGQKYDHNTAQEVLMDRVSLRTSEMEVEDIVSASTANQVSIPPAGDNRFQTYRTSSNIFHQTKDEPARRGQTPDAVIMARMNNDSGLKSIDQVDRQYTSDIRTQQTIDQEKTETLQIGAQSSAGPQSIKPSTVGHKSIEQESEGTQSIKQQSVEHKSSDRQSVGPHSIRHKSISPQSVGNKSVTPESVEPQLEVLHTDEHKSISPLSVGRKSLAPDSIDPQLAGPQTDDHQSIIPLSVGHKSVAQESIELTVGHQSIEPQSICPQTGEHQSMGQQSFGQKSMSQQSVGRKSEAQDSIEPQMVGAQTDEHQSVSPLSVGHKSLAPESVEPQMVCPQTDEHNSIGQQSIRHNSVPSELIEPQLEGTQTDERNTISPMSVGHKSVTPESIEPQSVKQQSIEPYSVGAQSLEHKSIEPEKVEPLLVEPEFDAPEQIEPQPYELEQVEQKQIVPQKFEQKQIELQQIVKSAPITKEKPNSTAIRQQTIKSSLAVIHGPQLDMASSVEPETRISVYGRNSKKDQNSLYKIVQNSIQSDDKNTNCNYDRRNDHILRAQIVTSDYDEYTRHRELHRHSQNQGSSIIDSQLTETIRTNQSDSGNAEKQLDELHDSTLHEDTIDAWKLQIASCAEVGEARLGESQSPSLTDEIETAGAQNSQIGDGPIFVQKSTDYHATTGRRAKYMGGSQTSLEQTELGATQQFACTKFCGNSLVSNTLAGLGHVYSRKVSDITLTTELYQNGDYQNQVIQVAAFSIANARQDGGRATITQLLPRESSLMTNARKNSEADTAPAEQNSRLSSGPIQVVAQDDSISQETEMLHMRRNRLLANQLSSQTGKQTIASGESGGLRNSNQSGKIRVQDEQLSSTNQSGKVEDSSCYRTPRHGFASGLIKRETVIDDSSRVRLERCSYDTEVQPALPNHIQHSKGSRRPPMGPQRHGSLPKQSSQQPSKTPVTKAKSFKINTGEELLQKKDSSQHSTTDYGQDRQIPEAIHLQNMEGAPPIATDTVSGGTGHITPDPLKISTFDQEVSRRLERHALHESEIAPTEEAAPMSQLLNGTKTDGISTEQFQPLSNPLRNSAAVIYEDALHEVLDAQTEKPLHHTEDRVAKIAEQISKLNTNLLQFQSEIEESKKDPLLKSTQRSTTSKKGLLSQKSREMNVGVPSLPRYGEQHSQTDVINIPEHVRAMQEKRLAAQLQSAPGRSRVRM